MRVFLVVVAFILAGCSGLEPSADQASNHTRIYMVTAKGSNQTKMGSLYKSVMQSANTVCKEKKRKYIHIIQLVDEAGTGYDSSYSTVIHFKRPQLYLTFSCLDQKVGKVVLVK
jgi:hypothetical protein